MLSVHDHLMPKLRAIDPQVAEQNGRRLLVLRDPLQISDKVVAIPLELAPLLALCDGTRDAGGLRTSLLLRFGIQASPQIIDRFLEVCDEALLLDNARYREATERVLAAFRAAPDRTPSLAGLSYPADPDELARQFEAYANGAVDRPDAAARFERVAAVISPHIDYERGGPVYGAVWNSAADLVRSADLAVVFGTDHYGGTGALTLTRKSYATPFGVLPSATGIVDALAAAIGPERAFADELHHRTEHSIELAATWLNYVRRDLTPLPMVPILCGSFHHYINGQGDPAGDHAIGALVHTLGEVTAGKRVLVVAGADLSHVGPAFGGEPQGPAQCGRVRAADQELIERTCAADAKGFFESVRLVGDRYNVCGVSPIYLTLRTLAHLRGAQAPTAETGQDGEPDLARAGRQIAYDTCPADDEGTSFVSICGVILD